MGGGLFRIGIGGFWIGIGRGLRKKAGPRRSSFWPRWGIGSGRIGRGTGERSQHSRGFSRGRGSWGSVPQPGPEGSEKEVERGQSEPWEVVDLARPEGIFHPGGRKFLIGRAEPARAAQQEPVLAGRYGPARVVDDGLVEAF